MKIRKTHIEDAPKVSFNLDGRIMFSSEKLEIVHLTLKPGEHVDQHVQPFDVIFFVISGKGILETPEENCPGTENTSVFVPAGLMRSWKNSGTADLKLIAIKDLA